MSSEVDKFIELVETMLLMYKLIKKMNRMVGMLIISREEYEEMYRMAMKVIERLRWLINELS